MKRPSEGRGNWNRSGRRSGGDRKIHIDGQPTNDKPLPMLGIACFEQRHQDCAGIVDFIGGKCECRCHGERTK